MPSADDKTPLPPNESTGKPAPAGDVTPLPTAKPHRVAVPTDPTQPIRLTGAGRTSTPIPTARPVAPPGAKPAVPPQATTPAPIRPPPPKPVTPAKTGKSTDDGLWLGSEQTMVGRPSSEVPSERLPVVLLEEEWLGNEKTTLPVSRPAPSQDDENWVGSEKTLVGRPVNAVPMTDSEEEYIGRDATIIGAVPGAGGGDKQGGGTTTRGGNIGKKTSPTMDDGWHLKGRQGPLTGKTVGDYEVGGILGEGGMGTVYRARQISLKRRVALKVLPPNLANDIRLRERFEQEARTASLLNSPNVVQVFAAGSFEDMVYFVMEFVEGTDLSEQLRTKQDTGELFTPDEAANFVIQAARGLAEAGKHNIVHRDIKPANLMITGKGVVKVADFGISKIAGEHGLTMTGTAVGTPAYCSPEQGRGDPVDSRADIYSLGVVFYELLTGKKPFEGATANALIYQHNYTEPKLPTDLRAEIPNAYQAVVLKCLQKDPAKRYQDAAELVSDLERVRAGSAPMTALMSAFGTGADEAMRRLGIKQRRIWPYLVAGILLVAIVGGGVVTYTKRSSAAAGIAAEVLSLRDSFKVLDSAKPVPKGTDTRLSKLASLVGKDDKDVIRWQTKLTRVIALQKALIEELDQPGLPAAAPREAATANLAKYKDDVGGGGEDVLRWQAILDAAHKEIAAERESLADLDKAPVVTVAMTERLNPVLEKLTGLVGKEDVDVVRWAGKIEQGNSRTGQLKSSLAMLDDSKAVITEAELARLDIDLSSLKAIVGDQDPGVRGWSAKLTAGRDNISRLRKNLTRLDAVELATTALQAALKSDLTTLSTLVEANDPDLKRWTRKVADSVARIASLRKSLARLDQPANLSVDEQKVYGDQLTSLRALVSADDGQLQAWSARMRAEQSNLATLQEVLKRLDNPQRMTVLELDACTKALAALVQLGGIAENQRLLAEHRVQDERLKLDDLRAYLHTHQLGDLVDQELADNLTLMSRIAGEQDEDVKHWRQRVDEYTRLHNALLPLDSATSVPEHADQLVTDFILIVGKQSPEVRRWTAKLQRIASLRQILMPLERQAPLPEGAAAAVAALLIEVGDKDLEAKRWSVKVARVTALVTALDGELKGAYVMPNLAPKQNNELVALVGLTDEHVASIATRVAVLAGPGKPAWGTDYGRDEYGPFTDLTIKGVTQRFRYIPSGTYMMGSPEDEVGRDKDETRVRVTLTHSFWMADSECTQGFWDQVVGKDNSRFPGIERPVERVSWDDCKTFCVTLSQSIPGLRARLPTEAEWEYACRAGIEGPYPGVQGPVDMEKLEEIAWFSKDTPTTQGVKRRLCNRLGLCDMLGNVWEWCEDHYGSYPPTAATDPIGREQETRVARGGSWGDSAIKVRAANRLAVRQDMRTLYLGMRLVIAVDWPPGQEPGAGTFAAAEIPVIAPHSASLAPVKPPVTTSTVSAPVSTPAPATPAAKPAK